MEVQTQTQNDNTLLIYGYEPRPSQEFVFHSDVRFLIIDAGRRWGKTITGENWLLEGACNEPGSIGWWIAPIYSQSKMAFRELLNAAKRGNAIESIRYVSHSELRIEFINGSIIEFKSGDNPDALRGAGLKRVVIDEAARVKRDVWEEVIRPAVSDTQGRVLFISTPKGKNWFYDIWTRGQDPLQPEYESWKFPTSDNPKVTSADIEQAKQSLPQDVFSQEYLAEFLDDMAGVFRNVKACMGSVAEEPNEKKTYFAGLDLARLTDFTVLAIFDEDGNQVYFDRFNTLDWAIQIRRIADVCKKYDAYLFVDSTGIGDPIEDALVREDLNVEGYKFTQRSKKALIELLMIAFEQKNIKILDEEVQKNELDIFEYKMNPSGTVHYSAPDGYHDDCVIALALANWGLENMGGQSMEITVL